MGNFLNDAEFPPFQQNMDSNNTGWIQTIAKAHGILQNHGSKATQERILQAIKQPKDWSLRHTDYLKFEVKRLEIKGIPPCSRKERYVTALEAYYGTKVLLRPTTAGTANPTIHPEAPVRPAQPIQDSTGSVGRVQDCQPFASNGENTAWAEKLHRSFGEGIGGQRVDCNTASTALPCGSSFNRDSAPVYLSLTWLGSARHVLNAGYSERNSRSGNIDLNQSPAMEHSPSVPPNYLNPEVLTIPPGVTEDLIDFSDDESAHLTRQTTQHAQPAPWYDLTPAPQQPISTLSTVTSIAKPREADVYNGRLDMDSSRTIRSHFSIDDFKYRNVYNNSSAYFPLERDANSHYRKWNHLLAVYFRDRRASL